MLYTITPIISMQQALQGGKPSIRRCKNQMKRKQLIILFVLTISLLAACNYEAGEDLYKEDGTTINVSDKEENYNRDVNNGNSQNYGYVRHQKSPVATDVNINNNTTDINREQLADMIGRLTVQIPNVNDAAALVTDEEVLIAYNTDSKNRNITADQVKRTAMSVVPRYFHVYVSDNPTAFKDLERFESLGPLNDNGEKMLEGTKKQMLKSPQGTSMSTGENANGETVEELNKRTNEKD